jgi:hypothetical protein
MNWFFISYPWDKVMPSSFARLAAHGFWLTEGRALLDSMPVDALCCHSCAKGA